VYLWVLAEGNLPFHQFRLCTSFPRVVLVDESLTVEAAGLAPRAMLVIEEMG
jgi:hypothetical protein